MKLSQNRLSKKDKDNMGKADKLIEKRYN